MNDEAPQPRTWGRTILIVIGVLLLATLPFVPWLSRGMKQSGTEKAILAAGGRASFGKKLVESADYFTDETDRSKKWLRDLIGAAYVDQLTMVELQKDLPPNIVKRIAALPAAETLDVSQSNLTDDDLVTLAEAVTLKKLWFRECDISDAGIESLQPLTNLMSLALDGTNVTDGGLAKLAELKNLKRLYLANTNVTDKGVAQLTGMSQLLGIGLENTGVTDGCLKSISELQELEEVRLSSTNITDAGAAALAQLPKLKSLSLRNTRLSSHGLSWLPACKNLEILDLEQTDVDDDVIEAIAEIPKLVLGEPTQDQRLRASDRST